MNFPSPLIAVSLAIAVLTAPGAWAAGDDHSHDHAGTVAAAGQALPRFAAVSETFELVGVLDGRQLVLYLDRFADNAPVRNAQIELEIGGAKLHAKEHSDARYEVMLAEAPQPGVMPITIVVAAGSEVDLLAGELDLHEADHRDEPAPAHSWREYAGWAVGGIAALALLGAASRRVMASRRARTGGAA